MTERDPHPPIGTFGTELEEISEELANFFEIPGQRPIAGAQCVPDCPASDGMVGPVGVTSGVPIGATLVPGSAPSTRPIGRSGLQLEEIVEKFLDFPELLLHLGFFSQFGRR